MAHWSYGTPSTASGSSTGSLSWSHTVEADSDLLLVAISVENTTSTPDVSGVTYGGTSLTKADDRLLDVSGNMNLAELWYLLAPSSGTDTVQVTLNQSVNEVCASALAVEGADNAGPEATNSGTAQSTDTISTSLTTLTDDALVVDVVSLGDANTLSPDTGQTEIWDVQQGTSAGGGSRAEDATAGSFTMGQTASASTNRLVQVVAAFAPSVPAPPGDPTIGFATESTLDHGPQIQKTAGDDANTDHTDVHMDSSAGFTPGSGNLVSDDITLNVNDSRSYSSRTPGVVEFAKIVDYSQADESDGGATSNELKYRVAPSQDTGITLSAHPDDPEHGAAWSVTDGTTGDTGGPYPRIVQHRLSSDPDWSNATEEVVPAGTTSGKFLGYSPGDQIIARTIPFHTDLFDFPDPGDGRVRADRAAAPTDTLTTESSVPMAVFQHHYRMQRASSGIM